MTFELRVATPPPNSHSAIVRSVDYCTFTVSIFRIFGGKLLSISCHLGNRFALEQEMHTAKWPKQSSLCQTLQRAKWLKFNFA